MARNLVVGIVLAGKDAASGVLRGVGSAAKTTGGAIAGLASRAKASFRDARMTIIALNQGIALLRRGMRLLDSTVGDAIRKNLEMRAANDDVRKGIVEFQRAMDLANARIGQFFIPILRGAIEVLVPLLKQFEAWAKANEKVVQTKLIQWLSGVQSAIGALATSIVYLSKIWHGWSMIVNAVQLAVNEGFALILDGVQAVIGGMASLAAAVGLDDMVVRLRGAQDAVKGLGAEFDASGDQAMVALLEDMRAMEETEAAIRSVAKTAQDTVGKIAVAALKHVGEQANFTAKNIDAIRMAMLKAALAAAEYAQMMRKFHEDAHIARLQIAEQETGRFVNSILALELKTIAELDGAWAAYYQRRGELSAEAQKEIEGHLQSQHAAIQEALRADVESVISSTANSLFEILKEQGRAVAEHTKSVGRAFGDMFKGIGSMAANMLAEYLIGLGVKAAAEKAAALFSIKTEAAKAAAGAASSQSSIPIIGPGLAVAAMVAMFATVMALSGKFHQGGILPGRTGQERPFVGLAGEMILPINQVPAALSMGFGPGGSQGSQNAPQQRAPMQVTVVQQLLATQGKTDLDRNLTESLLPVVQRWIDDGRLQV